MLDTANFFKKNNKRWQYHPYGTVVDDVYLIVKNGCKSKIEKSLENEVKLSYALLPLIVGLALWNVYYLLPVLLIFPYFPLNRRAIKRKYCFDEGFGKGSFIKNYFKIIYFFIDEKNKKNYRSICFTTLVSAGISYSLYLESEGLYWVISFSVISLIGSFVLSLITIKRIRTRSS